MPSMNHLSKNNTTLANRNGIHVLTLHSTEIVHHNPATGEVTLNSGGWQTATTRTRINQYMNTRGLNVGIFQKAREWFVSANGQILPFRDGMTVRV